MLVLIDGRTVYSPVFAGVFWETQDMSILDIDRIEVIRGPGGSIWGANAVNGVINVISKRATETKGTLVNVVCGVERARAVYGAPRRTLRQRGRVSRVRKGSLRGLTSARERRGCAGRLRLRPGRLPDRIGFVAPASQLTLQGDMYTGTTGLSSTAEANLSGGNLLGRWTLAGANHATSVQAYFDHTYRRVPNQYRGTLNTIDIDAQHHWTFGRHNVVFGGGYRHYDGDDLGDGPGFFFEPRERASHRLNVFAQDEITVARGVFLTLGSKFERNEFTGFEIQPTVRARWSAHAPERMGRRVAGGARADAIRHRPSVPHSRIDTESAADRLRRRSSPRASSPTKPGYRRQFHERAVDRSRGLRQSLRRSAHAGDSRRASRSRSPTR